MGFHRPCYTFGRELKELGKRETCQTKCDASAFGKCDASQKPKETLAKKFQPSQPPKHFPKKETGRKKDFAFFLPKSEVSSSGGGGDGVGGASFQEIWMLSRHLRPMSESLGQCKWEGFLIPPGLLMETTGPSAHACTCTHIYVTSDFLYPQTLMPVSQSEPPGLDEWEEYLSLPNKAGTGDNNTGSWPFGRGTQLNCLLSK